jgi:hypothetical protein
MTGLRVLGRCFGGSRRLFVLLLSQRGAVSRAAKEQVMVV